MSYKLAVIGGGSLYTLPLLHTLCQKKEVFPLNRVYLYDIDEKRQFLRYQAAEVMFNEIYPECEIKVAQTLDEAVKDVDYILVQIRTGGLDMREADEKIPLKHGCIGQETCGAGGLMYGMRSIADTLEIVDAARKYSKDSWIINFGNPASMLAEATRRYYRDDKRLVYLCDMTILMLDAFESALNLKKGELVPRYFGLNHFGWFTNIYDSTGKDRMPEIIKKLTSENVVPDELKNDADWVATFKRLGKMLKDLGGYIPSTYFEYYFYMNEIVKESNPDYTRANSVKDKKQAGVEKMCQQIIENNTIKGSGLDSKVHGEYIFDFIEATLHPKRNTQFLIPVVNDGAIPNIDRDAIVEIPCIVTFSGVEKLYFGEVDIFYKGMIENQYACERLCVDGVLENNLKKCVQGFALNRTITDVSIVKPLLYDLLQANKQYLPELWEKAWQLLD
ncbi:MAG TPA: 6-phospho-alpha-glucosidase [Erysipelotrichaceae bacterium]|nr:6-phospho-alpha-glucosidase [Erysipelotrichaceae bacterium]HQA85032.1 6-phospho-alpha-glucosidase [Erysipelotrichaceae bacterium]